MNRLRPITGMQRAAAAALFAAYLLVMAMAASPALHHWLHDNDDDPDHQCAAVTAVLGQFDRPPVNTAVLAAPARAWIERRATIYTRAVPRLFLLVSVLEHAPPVRG